MKSFFLRRVRREAPHGGAFSAKPAFGRPTGKNTLRGASIELCAIGAQPKRRVKRGGLWAAGLVVRYLPKDGPSLKKDAKYFLTQKSGENHKIFTAFLELLM